MEKKYIFLVLITGLIFFSEEVEAQKKVISKSGVSLIEVSKDGTHEVSVEGFSNKEEADKFMNSLAKDDLKNNLKVIKAVEVIKETENSSNGIGKLIRYGPWRMQNNLKIPEDNFLSFYRYVPEGKSRTGGASRNGKLIKIEKPYLSSIIELNQNAQVMVLRGQQYSVQVGKFTFDKSAINALKNISSISNLPVVVIIKNGIYHLLIEGFSSWEEAKRYVDQLSKLGYKGVVVKIKNQVKVNP